MSTLHQCCTSSHWLSISFWFPYLKWSVLNQLGPWYEKPPHEPSRFTIPPPPFCIGLYHLRFSRWLYHKQHSLWQHPKFGTLPLGSPSGYFAAISHPPQNQNSSLPKSIWYLSDLILLSGIPIFWLVHLYYIACFKTIMHIGSTCARLWGPVTQMEKARYKWVRKKKILVPTFQW